MKLLFYFGYLTGALCFVMAAIGYFVAGDTTNMLLAGIAAIGGLQLAEMTQ